MMLDRYDNKRQIIQNHARALLNLPTIIKYNIRETLDNIQKNIRALQTCKESVDSWSTLLIAVITINHK